MPETVTSATQSSVEDAEENIENLEHIIRREFSGVFDVCKVMRFKNNLKKNVKKLKTAPAMVEDFCEEVKSIVEDISEAFDEDKRRNATEVDNKKEESAAGNEKVGKSQETNEKPKERKKKNGDGKKKDEDNKESNEKPKERKEKNGDGKNKDEDNKEKGKSNKDKKPDYHKQLKMEKIGLDDIDRIFTDVMAGLNKFISTREKMQQARESFEKIMKTLCNFDGEKEVKEYVQELKKKALEGKIHIYVDTTDGEIKLDSVKGVDPPAPYRNAVKALNDMKASAKSAVDLEPEVLHDVAACAEHVAKIEPAKDFKKMVSGMKEAMTIPKKVKAFNENRKKVQQAPGIVKEFGLYVKQLVVDIVNAFTGEDETEKTDENSSEKESTEKHEQEVEAMVHTPGKGNGIEENREEENKEKEKHEEEVEAIVHTPGKAEKIEENQIVVA